MNTDPSKGHLIIDATHGGIQLATEYQRKNPNNKIYLYDIYHTLKKKQITQLKEKKIIKINSLNQINNLKYLEIIYPIHLPLTTQEITQKINNPHIKIKFLTHHQAVKKLFKPLKNVLKIEITGVKGKTSSAFILKEILNNYNPLLLTSLGIIYKNKTIKKDISITPANILQTINIAKNKKYQTAIFENSLGTSAIGDIALLTNIAENYPIAQNQKNAAQAKSQIFKNKLIAINQETLNQYYQKESTIYKNKINTFCLKNNTNANLYCLNINYGLEKTNLKIKYSNIQTINNNRINGEFEITTFAPYKFHVENILGAVCVALSLEISETDIINGLKRFKGLPGRTNITKINNKIIIEEINPGINTKAIEYSLNMIKNPEEFIVIIGGDYGITCEEIKENELCKLLNKNKELNLVLTGKLGENIKNNHKSKFEYVEDYRKTIKSCLKKDKNILFIYRSDYKKLKKR